MADETVKTTLTEDEIQHPDEERKPLHGAVLEIDRLTFERMLVLPPDVQVVAIMPDPTRAALILHLVGDSLPEVPDGHMAPHARLLFQGKRDEDGHWWRRMSFEVM